ncbi:adenylyltransferase/cytidyltransferase family protein [Sphingobacterium sp. LRF_L2]|uniref:adenylyltransferase/cytidyltransferase family protein n=1 Tax=Sphingobacterium sp. LRF_L2 TaxID=3369421 RepID=UPI003F5E9CF4
MKIGITLGVFDLLHVGHLVMLEEAKKHCDYLIVGLQAGGYFDEQGDSTKEPAQTVVERFIKLEGCRFVDEILPYDSLQDVLDILQSRDVDVRFIGEEYKNKDFIGKRCCEQNDIQIVYTKRRHRFSSHSLRDIVSDKEKAKMDLSIQKDKSLTLHKPV